MIYAKHLNYRLEQDDELAVCQLGDSASTTKVNREGACSDLPIRLAKCYGRRPRHRQCHWTHGFSSGNQQVDLNSAKRSGMVRQQLTKTIDLALQGGGSHGALTWGVLDRILEDERLEISGISGTSAEQ